jgi:hypothetical protein
VARCRGQQKARDAAVLFKFLCCVKRCRCPRGRFARSITAAPVSATHNVLRRALVPRFGGYGGTFSLASYPMRSYCANMTSFCRGTFYFHMRQQSVTRFACRGAEVCAVCVVHFQTCRYSAADQVCRLEMLWSMCAGCTIREVGWVDIVMHLVSLVRILKGRALLPSFQYHCPYLESRDGMSFTCAAVSGDESCLFVGAYDGYMA